MMEDVRKTDQEIQDMLNFEHAHEDETCEMMEDVRLRLNSHIDELKDMLPTLTHFNSVDLVSKSRTWLEEVVGAVDALGERLRVEIKKRKAAEANAPKAYLCVITKDVTWTDRAWRVRCRF
jgi:hypothetical protein